MGVGEGRGFLPTLPGERSYKWENAELIRKREETPGATLSLSSLSLSFPYCHVSTRSPRIPHTETHAETPGSSCRYLLPRLPLALSFSPLVNLNPLSYYFSSFSRYVCPLALLLSTPIFLSTTCVALFICDFSNLCKCTSSVCSLLSVCAP